MLFSLRIARVLRAMLRPAGYLEPTAVVLDGKFGESDLGRALLEAFHAANKGKQNLPIWVQEMMGMSGLRYRYLINHLVRLVRDPCYLEVGSWTGSTACAAVVNNECWVTCVDDWSLFGGPREEFHRNIGLASGSSQLQILEQDFRAVRFDQLAPKANIYLFDGPHSEVDQFDGIALALPALQDEFILVVDDFNWNEVRTGTLRAITTMGLSVSASITIRTDAAGSDPVVSFQHSDWHNGYFLAVVKKSR